MPGSARTDKQNRDVMNPQLLSSMPADAWRVLIAVCLVIASVGAIGLRLLRQSSRSDVEHRWPLCSLSLLMGPLVGLVFGGIAYVTAPDDWESCDVRDLIFGIMTLSVVAGIVASIAILLIVDLPQRLLHNRSVSAEASSDDAHE